MIKSQYLVFYNYWEKFEEPPVKGLLFKNSKNCEGTNGKKDDIILSVEVL